MQQQQTPSPDQIAFRIAVLEQTIKDIQLQLREYELARENELKLQNMRAELDHMRVSIGEIKLQLADLNSKSIAQEAALQKQDATQRESQSRLQIRVLYGTVAAFLSVISGILLALFNHWIG